VIKSRQTNTQEGCPRLTIALPVYNGARFLEQTVQSLLSQKFADFELIIGDNASTDWTREIAQKLAAGDRRISYVRNERNLGLAGNFNALFQRASTELFKWAAADDAYEPEFLERCVQALDTHPTAVLAYARTCFIDENGGPLEITDPGWDLRFDSASERLLYAIQAGHWVNSIHGVIRREALARTRLLPCYPGGDYVLLGELSLLGTFIEVPETLFLRRIHPQGSSQIRTDPDRIREYHRGTDKGPSCPTWQRTFGHLVTIITGPLGCGIRARLLAGLARASANRAPALRRELLGVLRWLLRGRTAPSA
jgi:glycosyltransferase involved in cell wall biosynthesis